MYEHSRSIAYLVESPHVCILYVCIWYYLKANCWPLIVHIYRSSSHICQAFIQDFCWGGGGAWTNITIKHPLGGDIPPSHPPVLNPVYNRIYCSDVGKGVRGDWCSIVNSDVIIVLILEWLLHRQCALYIVIGYTCIWICMTTHVQQSAIPLVILFIVLRAACSCSSDCGNYPTCCGSETCL